VPGRPRDPDLERRLLAATWTLLQRDGYDALSLTKVAAEAKAHRTDVYRRWPNKIQLVVDVLAEHLPPIAPVDTGSLLGDTRSYVEGLAASWSSPWIDGLVGALADLRQDADAELAFIALSERRGQVMRSALARAVERGEIPEVPDLRIAGDLLEGLLMHHRMIGRQPLTPDYLDAVASLAYQVFSSGRLTR
jgi:AcrR family transcriptional regulator